MKRMTYRIAAIAVAVALFMTMIAGNDGYPWTEAYAAEVPEGFVLEYADMLPGEEGNLFAVNEGDHFGYGLCSAQLDEDEFTLQLYGPGSQVCPGGNTYLRKLCNIDYSTVLDEENSFVRWYSDNPGVVEVDEFSGLITARSAGCARITVSTVMSSGYSQALAFNTVVVPEGRIEGTSNGFSNNVVYRSQPWQRQIVINTNAAHASDLNWQVFRAEKVVETSEITDDVEQYFDISDTDGKVTISDLPAGTYTITAMPRKTAAGLHGSADYGRSSGGIRSLVLDYLKITLVIPFDFTDEDISLEYYNRNIYGTYDILKESNAPAGLFGFVSEDENVAYVDPDTGMIEARGIGSTRITVSPLSADSIENAFGRYYDAVTVTGSAIITSLSTETTAQAVSGAAIGYYGGDIVFNVNVADSVALNTKNVSIPAGSSTRLSLVIPNPYHGSIYWSSSNPKIATVDQNGIVQANGKGSANILARIEVNGVTKTARCRIDVTNAVAYAALNTPADSIYVGETLAVRLGGDSLALQGTYEWSISDESIAAFTEISGLNAVIKGIRPGTVVVTSYDDNLGITASKPVTISLKPEPPVNDTPVGTGTPTPAPTQSGTGNAGGSGSGSGGSVIYYGNNGSNYPGSYYPGSSTISPTPATKTDDTKSGTTSATTDTNKKNDTGTGKTVTTDRFGNVTTHEVIKNPDRSVSTIKTIENTDGSKSVVELTEYVDNSSIFRTENSDVSGNRSIYTSYMDKTGKVIMSLTENTTVDKRGEVTLKTNMTKSDGSYSEGIRVTSKDGKSSFELLEVDKNGDMKLTLDNVYPNGETIHRIFTSGDAANFKLKKYTTDRRLASVASNLMLSDNSKYSVVSVAKNSLKNNNSITRLTIGKNVTAIGKDAFRNASKLKNIVIYADKLKRIGEGAFKGIAKNAVIRIAGSKKAFESVKKKIKSSGISKGVTFERIETAE